MMSTSERRKLAPIEVWLTQANIAVRCRVVHEDEHTEEVDVESLSMRGAQREVTGRLIEQGYEPATRWVAAGDGEMMRKFRPNANAR